MDTARRQADGEAAEQLAAEIEEEGRLTVEREKNALPMSTFHEVIKSLWDYDPALQLNDDAVARETVLAATLIADLIAGDIQNHRATGRPPPPTILNARYGSSQWDMSERHWRKWVRGLWFHGRVCQKDTGLSNVSSFTARSC